MTTLLSLLALGLHAGLLLAAAPIVAGMPRWLQARLLGRSGPPLIQPWRDLARLLRKQPAIAESATWYSAIAPVAAFAPMLAASMLVPSFTLGMATAPLSDLIVIAALAGASRAAMVLAGMDAGGGIGGLGGMRVMTAAVFAEPALVLAAFALALLAGSTNLDAIAAALSQGTAGLRVSVGLVSLALLVLALVDAGRMPVDDAASPFELAMVGEALRLEYSGRDLALLVWAEQLRLLLWLGLIISVAVPFGVAPGALAVLRWMPGLIAWAAKVALLGGGMAVLATVTARLPVARVPALLGVAALLGLLAVVFLLASQTVVT